MTLAIPKVGIRPLFELPIGTVVYLKTGSPPMVVSGARTQDDGIVSVAWFDRSQSCRECFDRVNLVTEKPE